MKKKKKKKQKNSAKKEKPGKKKQKGNFKKKKKEERGNVPTKKKGGKKRIEHGHFCPLSSHIFSLQFSLYFGEKTFWWAWGENTWTPSFISFLPTQPNTLKKVFLPIFSSKFSIHPISPPNKHILSVWLEEWKSGRIEKILISLLFVWLGVKKWMDEKSEFV